MRLSERFALCLTAIGIGGSAGALLGLLVLGAFYLLGGGSPPRGDDWAAFAIVLALSTIAGALYGYQAFSDS
jgi:hypothetical protein